LLKLVSLSLADPTQTCDQNQLPTAPNQKMSDYETASNPDSEKEETTIASDAVVNKYKVAGEIANDALKAVLAEVKVDASTYDLCTIGDKVVADRTAALFKKQKQMKKGLAWPTSISVNNIICHYSPLSSYKNPVIIREGDVVKVEIGAHIDGFPAFSAHSVVVGASKDNQVTGRKADVMHAAYNAAQVALRMLKPGNVNREITKVIQRTTKSYDCVPIQNMASYNIEKDVVEGEKSILQNPQESIDRRLQNNKDESPTGTESAAKEALLGDKCDIEVNDVWAIDVLASTGEGKVLATEVKTSLFRRDPASSYQLKMKASRDVLSKATEQHGFMTFSLRSFENETRTRLGLKENVSHEVITEHPVLQEKSGVHVAQFKYTVLVLASGLLQVTGLPFEAENYNTECKIEDKEIVDLLSTSISKKAKKRNKKKAKSAAAKDMEAALAN